STNINDTEETITNTYKSTTPETTQVNVNKVWKDNKSTHNPITVHLLADDKDTGKTVKLHENNWSGSFTNLDKQANGKDITYSVKEDTPTDYDFAVNRLNDTNNFTITNTPKKTTTDEKTSLTVTKSWNDENDKDGIRPDSVKVNLLADGKDTGKTITLNEDNNWTNAFKNLDKKINDKDIHYTVKENDVSGYKVSPDPVYTDSTHVTITNKHTPKSVTPSDNKRTFTVVK